MSCVPRPPRSPSRIVSLACTAALTGVVLAGCGSGDSDPDADPAGPPPTEQPEMTAVYEVTGTGTAEVTYDVGGPSRSESVKLPWRTEVPVDGEPGIGLLSISVMSSDAKNLACSITAEGLEVDAQKAGPPEAGWTIVQCHR